MKNNKTKDYIQTERYLKDLLYIINTNLTDLEFWCVMNQDKCLDEVIEIKEAFEKLKEKL